jgi:hypothetical protein
LAQRHWAPARNVPFSKPNLLQPGLLSVQAAFFDIVIACSISEVEKVNLQPLDCLAKWHSWITTVLRLETTYPAGQGPTEVLWRTLIADTAGNQHPAPPEYGTYFRHYFLTDLSYLKGHSEDGSSPEAARATPTRKRSCNPSAKR